METASPAERAILTDMLIHYACFSRSAGGRASGVLRGAHLLKTPTARRFYGILLWCLARKIDPIEFIEAQFGEWKDRSRYPSPYPTPRSFGPTDACLGRYLRYRRRNETAQAPEDILKLGGHTLAVLLAHRKDLTSEDVLSTPMFIRLLPPAFAKQRPEFRAALARGEFRNSHEALKDYLD